MEFNIAKRRKSLGMTQEALAKASGVSRATIASLESGAKNVALSSTILKIADALRCDVSDLFLKESSSQLDT